MKLKERDVGYEFFQYSVGMFMHVVSARLGRNSWLPSSVMFRSN